MRASVEYMLASLSFRPCNRTAKRPRASPVPLPVRPSGCPPFGGSAFRLYRGSRPGSASVERRLKDEGQGSDLTIGIAAVLAWGKKWGKNMLHSALLRRFRYDEDARNTA